MAGYIGINEEDGLSLGSISFTSIVDYTRKCFKPNELIYAKEIYDMYDNYGQQAIELEEQQSDGFNAFFQATYSALQQYKENTKIGSPLRSEFTEGTIQSWQELIDMLKNDKRFHRKNDKYI